MRGMPSVGKKVVKTKLKVSRLNSGRFLIMFNPLHSASSRSDILPDLMQNFGAQYKELSASEKSNLIEEFAKFRSNSVPILLLNHIISQLNNLHYCTGTEVILYATHGLTDVPFNSLNFATEGVQDFMGATMGIDKQKIMSRMEGFALQGVKGLFHSVFLFSVHLFLLSLPLGAALNHRQLITQAHLAIHDIINRKLYKSIFIFVDMCRSLTFVTRGHYW